MNIFDLPFLPQTEELSTVLVDAQNARVERIVSTGQTSGWYDQEQSEFVVLLQGTAKLEYVGGRILTLTQGDTVLIMPHEKHRVCYTSSEPPCVWLCVFF